jgi:hypothetical protein
MSNLYFVPPPRTPPANDDQTDVVVPEIREPPSMEEDEPEDEDEDQDEEQGLARARALFSNIKKADWAVYVAADEAATQEKMARLRAARLARAKA